MTVGCYPPRAGYLPVRYPQQQGRSKHDSAAWLVLPVAAWRWRLLCVTAPFAVRRMLVECGLYLFLTIPLSLPVLLTWNLPLPGCWLCGRNLQIPDASAAAPCPRCYLPTDRLVALLPSFYLATCVVWVPGALPRCGGRMGNTGWVGTRLRGHATDDCCIALLPYYTHLSRCQESYSIRTCSMPGEPYKRTEGCLWDIVVQVLP